MTLTLDRRFQLVHMAGKTVIAAPLITLREQRELESTRKGQCLSKTIIPVTHQATTS